MFDFKEEIAAETLVVTPRMEPIGKVTNVQKIQVIRGIDERHGGNGSFSDFMERAVERQKGKKVNGVTGSNPSAALPPALEGKMHGYDQARAAYYYMAFSTTDLKG